MVRWDDGMMLWTKWAKYDMAVHSVSATQIQTETLHYPMLCGTMYYTRRKKSIIGPERIRHSPTTCYNKHQDDAADFS